MRVGEVQYTLCARLLDQGAQGIILPRVEDPKVLEQALSWLRFPPLGVRGFGINPTMVDYETRSMPEIIEHQNRETLSVVQFETVRAVERADELLSLKGLDVMMIGPADLSIALGIPGQFDQPAADRDGRRADREVQCARRGARHSDARRRHGEACGRSAACALSAWRRSTCSCWRNAGRRWPRCVRRNKEDDDGPFSAGLQHLLDPRAALA